MIKSGLTVQSYDPKVIRLKPPVPSRSGHDLCPFSHMYFFSRFATLFPPQKKSPPNPLSRSQMGFLDPFGPFLAHFDPPWGPLEPPMQPFGGSERLAGAAMTGRGAEAPRGGEGEGRARVCGKTQLITRFCTFSK